MDTKHLQNGATLARVDYAQLSQNERHLIFEGDLAYCRTHQMLRWLLALPECPVYMLACKCDDPRCPNEPKVKDIGPCEDVT